MRLAATYFLIGESEDFFQRNWEGFPVSINLVYAFFGLFYLAFYLRNPKNREPLYFSLFATLFALYQFTGTRFVGELVLDTTWVSRVRLASLALLPATMAAFIHSYFFQKNPMPVPLRAIVVCGLLFSGWFLLSPFSNALAGVTFWQAQILLVVAIIAGYAFVGWYRKIPFAGAFAISYILFGLAVIADTLIVRFFVYEPRLAQIAFLALVTTLALLIAIRHMELHRSTETFSNLVEA